jgi:molybdate transport system substrate-binding protein
MRWQHLVAGMLLAIAPVAHADEVRVLAAGAAKAGLEKIAPEFERATGHTVRASFDTVGAQRDRVLNGELADLVILSDAAIAQLRAAGRIEGEAKQIGVVAVSLAVRTGAVVPDISTAQALQQALESAATIAYADPARGATAGTHFDQVLRALGLRDRLQPRISILPFGVDVIREVSTGRFALGVSQSSEILQHEGIAMVGPLPPPHALTTGYAAATVTRQTGAAALLEFLARPQAVQKFRASGFLQPAPE